MKRFAPTLLLIVLAFSPAAFCQHINSSIRAVDFSNFTYPYTWNLVVTGSRRKTFTLHNGTFKEENSAVGMSLGHVLYGDVTGDGREEAIVFLGVRTGGSAIPGCIYIYAIRKNRPSLLWAFTTGDRADGGLRQAYVEDTIGS